MKEINGVEIIGPMKWIILVFGPNHHAKDLKQLLQHEYKNLNIIVILVANKQKLVAKNLDNTGQRSGVYDGQHSNLAKQPSNTNIQADQLDLFTKNLNKLARQTPEGYMIIINQKDF